MPQAKFVLHNAQGGFHDIVDVGRNFLRFSVACEFEQSLDNGFATLGFLDNDIQAFFKRPPGGTFLLILELYSRIPASGLLISWAIPAAMRPNDDILSIRVAR